ncbi:MAG: CPBP family intramembrane metalloprotease [Spirochaetaceae bacterium]|nr:MAG: CPBP family intramembrane metalloprotease [Spirochaetaceae bacterium]
MRSVLRRTAWMSGVAVVVLAAPRIGGLVANLFDFSRVDPDGAFAWISVHHVVQALILLAIMIPIARGGKTDFGLGWGDRRVGYRFVGLFALGFVGYTAVAMVIALTAGTFRSFPYPLSTRNIAGQLAFQLMLSGPSEELIFRGFAITMLAPAVKGALLAGRVSGANLIAAVLFGLAHLSVTLAPFRLTYSPFQVLYATGLGILYGICYERSQSVYYPMMMHSISNVVAVGVSVIATACVAGQ